MSFRLISAVTTIEAPRAGILGCGFFEVMSERVCCSRCKSVVKLELGRGMCQCQSDNQILHPAFLRAFDPEWEKMLYFYRTPSEMWECPEMEVNNDV